METTCRGIPDARRELRAILDAIVVEENAMGELEDEVAAEQTRVAALSRAKHGINIGFTIRLPTIV